ncbi:transposase-like protein DUF772 [Paraburkholderia sp. BL6665CI2N2]|nr:transposase-like protein DUF772 [Paraburkholderia sp. BL6665CI2N2]
MKRFFEGEDRKQVTLLPERLDDFVAEDNPVRIIEAFVEERDLASPRFDGAMPSTTGRPSHHPGVLLNIYIYGYLNRVQSSRRLERECQRNVELMRLTGRLAPDFKTIADFRRDDGTGIRNVCLRSSSGHAETALWRSDADRIWRASACHPEPTSPKGGRCPFHLGHLQSFVWTPRRTFRRRLRPRQRTSAGVASPAGCSPSLGSSLLAMANLWQSDRVQSPHYGTNAQSAKPCSTFSHVKVCTTVAGYHCLWRLVSGVY